MSTKNEPSTNRMKLTEFDRSQVATQKAIERETNRGRAIEHQRPNYLAKWERRSS